MEAIEAELNNVDTTIEKHSAIERIDEAMDNLLMDLTIARSVVNNDSFRDIINEIDRVIAKK